MDWEVRWVGFSSGCMGRGNVKDGFNVFGWCKWMVGVIIY